jgi:hypothetical protein
MNELNEEPSIVTAHLVPQEDRLAYIEKTFGIHFTLAIEAATYLLTEKMAKDYHGGFWNFYRLSNSGFYMAPDGEEIYSVSSANYFQGELSSDALGIVSCLTAYSHLSFSKNEELGRLCAQQYYLLREYMYAHPEVAVILRAID